MNCMTCVVLAIVSISCVFKRLDLAFYVILVNVFQNILYQDACKLTTKDMCRVGKFLPGCFFPGVLTG